MDVSEKSNLKHCVGEKREEIITIFFVAFLPFSEIIIYFNMKKNRDLCAF